MPTTDKSGLVNFTQTVALSGICSVALDMIEGGVLGRLATAIRSEDGEVLLTGGIDPPALITQHARHVSWMFTVPQGARSLSWSVVAFGPVANASSYKAQVTVVNTQGKTVATSSFRGKLESFNDPAVSDGVFVTAPQV
jgi:hypothetical protein